MKLVWDDIGKRFFETGIQQCVLYLRDASGVYASGFAWNGVTNITESPSGAEASPIYADNAKYLNLMSAEDFGVSIEAYTYPEEFEACDGSGSLAEGVIVNQQSRAVFGLCYKTLIGNDVSADLGYKLHIVYGGMAAPSEKAFSSINESTEATTFSWEVTTTPVPVPGFKPSASIVIDSTKVDAAKLAALEVILYGKDATTEPVAPAVVARLPLPAELITLLSAG